MEQFARMRIEKPGSIKLFSELQKRIFNQIPNHTEGLDLKRMATFIKSEGLRPAPRLFISKEDLDTHAALFQEGGRWHFEDSNAGYSNVMNIAVVVRDGLLEKANGTVLSEAFMMHELGHASATWMSHAVQFVPDNLGNLSKLHTFPRTGFAVTKNTGEASQMELGQYLEEGFAQMFYTKYMSQYMGTAARDIIASELRVPLDDLMNLEVLLRMPEGLVRTSPANVSLNPNGEPSITSPGYAQAGLQSLWHSIEGLEQAMRDARNEPEALRKIPKLVNSVEPGLYGFLTSLKYTHADFIRGTDRIQTLLGTNKTP